MQLRGLGVTACSGQFRIFGGVKRRPLSVNTVYRRRGMAMGTSTYFTDDLDHDSDQFREPLFVLWLLGQLAIKSSAALPWDVDS